MIDTLSQKGGEAMEEERGSSQEEVFSEVALFGDRAVVSGSDLSDCGCVGCDGCPCVKISAE